MLVPVQTSEGQEVHIGEVTRPYESSAEQGYLSHSVDWLRLDAPWDLQRSNPFILPTIRKIEDDAAWEQVRELIGESVPEPVTVTPPPPPPDPLVELARKLMLDLKFLREREVLLEEKQQVIFQRPPGTGKTFVARQLAECLAGTSERVRLVQFHPSYAYEDFVQGLRPTLTAGG